MKSHLGTKKAFGKPVIIVTYYNETVIFPISQKKWNKLKSLGAPVEG